MLFVGCSILCPCFGENQFSCNEISWLSSPYLCRFIFDVVSFASGFITCSHNVIDLFMLWFPFYNMVIDPCVLVLGDPRDFILGDLRDENNTCVFIVLMRSMKRRMRRRGNTLQGPMNNMGLLKRLLSTQKIVYLNIASVWRTCRGVRVMSFQDLRKRSLRGVDGCETW